MKADGAGQLKICELARSAMRVTEVPGARVDLGAWLRTTLVAATGAKATPRRPMAPKVLLPLVSLPLFSDRMMAPATVRSTAPWFATVARSLRRVRVGIGEVRGVDDGDGPEPL